MYIYNSQYLIFFFYPNYIMYTIIIIIVYYYYNCILWYIQEEISDMVEEKKKLSKVPLNFAMEKATLLLRKDKAEQLGDEKEIELINSKLDELNNMKDEKTKLVDEKLDNWTKLNERNRKMNIIENRKAEVQASQERKRLGK